MFGRAAITLALAHVLVGVLLSVSYLNICGLRLGTDDTAITLRNE